MCVCHQYISLLVCVYICVIYAQKSESLKHVIIPITHRNHPECYLHVRTCVFTFQETISTCRFAQRVALIKNEAVLNEELDPKLVHNELLSYS